jgi:hypothetical protein
MALINKLSAIGEAIREKTGKEDLLTLEQMPEEIRGISGGGSGEEFHITSYAASFTFATEVEEITDNITLHLERASSLGNLTDLKNINAPKMTVYISNKCTGLSRSFGRGNSSDGGALQTIEIIGNLSKVTTYNQAFQGRYNLREIICELDFTSITTANGLSNMFTNTPALEEVRFKENTLQVSINLASNPLLSNDSIESIIKGLVDMTDSTSPSLFLHKDVKAKLTETQIATITNKNWTLA